MGMKDYHTPISTLCIGCHKPTGVVSTDKYGLWHTACLKGRDNRYHRKTRIHLMRNIGNASKAYERFEELNRVAFYHYRAMIFKKSDPHFYKAYIESMRYHLSLVRNLPTAHLP